MKRCITCRMFYPLTNFYRNASKADGLQNICKQCTADRDKSRRIHDPHRQEQLRIHKRRHYHKTKARQEAMTAEEREPFRLRINANSRHYVARHPTRRIAYIAHWVKTHPANILAKNQRRRAQKANAPLNDLTSAQWREIQDAQDHRCYYCGKRCKGRLTQDHITPLSKGGSHTLHNVIGACQSCNSKKHAGVSPTLVQPLLLTIAAAKKTRKAS